MISQLGDDDYHKRVAAEKRLIEIAEADLKTVHKQLQSALTDSTDPEIKFRLRSVIRTISATLPVQQIAFTDATLKNKTWQNYYEPNAAKFSIRDGVVEIDSTKNINDGLMFLHHLEKERQVQRLVLDAEIKMLAENRDRKGTAGLHLNIEDRHSGHAMMIQQDGVFAYESAFEHKMDTTDRWHHYRMVVEGPVQQLFVDDMTKPISVLRRSGSGRNWVSFGDGASTAGARAQIRNVKFSRFKSQQKKINR